MIKLTLKAARVNSGFTQKQASILIGVSSKTLCAWEKGDSFPTPKHIDKICRLYGVNYDDITFRPPIRFKRIRR